MVSIRISIFLLAFLKFSFAGLFGQHPRNLTPGEIHHAIEKLNFLGSVLYVAAHPDDENTRAISYFANHIKARTAYLSVTRGDGGQNLIGPEMSEFLGVIRTQELLAARKIDGGEQWFTRANDFGYSKHSNETLNIWEREEVLKDVVWAIRSFRPDVIINRFDHTTAGNTHGHHTASAILSFEAFDISNDSSVFQDQLKYVRPHKPERLFFNTSWWFYGSREKFEQADKSDLLEIDMGVYYPWMGLSNSEVAAESRSQHKSQGFGSTGTRGQDVEYLKFLKGTMPANVHDVFDGINTTWSRVEGAGHITQLVESILDHYQFTDPAASVPGLLEVYDAIYSLPDGYWKEVKLNEIKNIIASCMGLFTEAVTQQHKVIPGGDCNVIIEVANRSGIQASVQRMYFKNADFDTLTEVSLKRNDPFIVRKKLNIFENTPFTGPYWLKERGSIGMYKVPQQEWIGKPLKESPLSIVFHLEVLGRELILEKEVQYKFNSPEDGPVYRPLEIVPPFLVSFSEKAYIIKKGSSKDIQVNVTSLKTGEEVSLALQLPNGWRTEPENISFTPEMRGQEQSFIFTVHAPEYSSEVDGKALVTTGTQSFSFEMKSVDYPHIPFQTILKPAEARIVSVDLQTTESRIAYIMGAGDEIPQGLRQMNYTVDVLEAEKINGDLLGQYQAVIIGVRAYNKWDVLRYKQSLLMDFVHNGGTLIVQFNTSSGLVTDQLGPYPISLSRDRVSVEEAPVRILSKEHRVLKFPNEIVDSDFDGWVQERGLYFPGEWDSRYTAVLSSNDPGETPKDGGLLIAPYGKGWFMYTGYSWFRQIPAGVPGAYRILANMIAMNGNQKP